MEATEGGRGDAGRKQRELGLKLRKKICVFCICFEAWLHLAVRMMVENED